NEIEQRKLSGACDSDGTVAVEVSNDGKLVRQRFMRRLARRLLAWQRRLQGMPVLEAVHLSNGLQSVGVLQFDLVVGQERAQAFGHRGEVLNALLKIVGHGTYLHER